VPDISYIPMCLWVPNQVAHEPRCDEAGSFIVGTLIINFVQDIRMVSLPIIPHRSLNDSFDILILMLIFETKFAEPFTLQKFYFKNHKRRRRDATGNLIPDYESRFTLVVVQSSGFPHYMGRRAE
jgi:hypothetical protein